MITVNGKEAVIAKPNEKREKELSKWAKSACDRIFSHYSKEELELMRKQNA